MPKHATVHIPNRRARVEMKAHPYKIATIALLLLLGFLAATTDRLKIDGISGEIWNLIFATDTKYADGYSDNGFNQIKIGMAEWEVPDIPGEPLTKWSPYRFTRFQDSAHFVGIQYNESPSGTGCDSRIFNLHVVHV